MVAKAIAGEELPIFGNSKQIRDWIHVSDHVTALSAIMSRGPKTGSFNIGASGELQNIEIVSRICSLLDETVPKSTGSYLDQITFVRDRPGHDTRYALNWGKIHDVIGWRPVISIENGCDKRWNGTSKINPKCSGLRHDSTKRYDWDLVGRRDWLKAFRQPWLSQSMFCRFMISRPFFILVHAHACKGQDRRHCMHSK